MLNLIVLLFAGASAIALIWVGMEFLFTSWEQASRNLGAVLIAIGAAVLVVIGWKFI